MKTEEDYENLIARISRRDIRPEILDTAARSCQYGAAISDIWNCMARN
jgi:hypothetical protein